MPLPHKAPSGTMSSKRQILELLTRDELQMAVDDFGLDVADKRVRDDLIESLTSSRRASLSAILQELPRDRLKDICLDLDLSDAGRDKEAIVARILGEASGDGDKSTSGSSLDGESLYNARMAVGLSQAEVGERIGVSQATVSNWENDRGRPAEDQIRELAEFLDLPRPGQGAARRDGPADEVSAFGVWLSRTRNDANLTVPELANRSEVSAIQIANIEAGRTQNPRKLTRDRLIAALGRPAPEEAIAATEREAEVG